MKTVSVLISLLALLTYVKDGLGQRSVDLVLVMDSSEHMVQEKKLWQETKEFINNRLLLRLPISSRGYRVSLVTYGSSIKTEWSLRKTVSGKYKTIRQIIKDLDPMGGEINSMAALIDRARTMFNRRNDRPKSPNVAVIVYNRFSCNTSFKGVASAVTKLQQKASVFVVTNDVGSVDFDEMASLTGVPDFIFRYQDYRQLLAALSFYVENNITF